MDKSDALAARDIGDTRTKFSEVLGLTLDSVASIQTRDQMILENLGPEIEAVIAANRKLAAKREDRPLDVRIFYGTAHRSLLDAVIAKDRLAPVEGFSAQDSADSVKNDLLPNVYGKFLRDQEITVEDLERVQGYTAFGSVVKTHKYYGDDLSGRLLVSKFLELEDELDLTDFRHMIAQIREIFEG